ncbi:MAG TPA: hypothetical protein V6C91_03390 [Coleofasciculaceae cyanobacterium]
MQEGFYAGGRREESLYSKLFNLFERRDYFRRAVLAARVATVIFPLLPSDRISLIGLER